MLEQSRYALENESVLTAHHLFQEWLKSFRKALPPLPSNSEYELAQLLDTPLAQGLFLQQELNKVLSRCERLMDRLLANHPTGGHEALLQQHITDHLEFEVKKELENWCCYLAVDCGETRPLCTLNNMNLIVSKFPEYHGDAEAEWKTDDKINIEQTGRVLRGKSDLTYREYIVTFLIAGDFHVQKLYSTAGTLELFCDNLNQRGRNRTEVARQLLESEGIPVVDENVLNMVFAMEYLMTVLSAFHQHGRHIIGLTLDKVKALHHIITGDTTGISPHQKITTFEGQLKEYEKIKDMNKFCEHLEKVLKDLDEVQNCTNMCVSQFGECEPLAKILARFCNAFLKAHPFADGNGRVCKLICCYVIQMVTQHLFCVFDKRGLLNYNRWCSLLMKGDVSELTRAFQIEIHRCYYSYNH